VYINGCCHSNVGRFVMRSNRFVVFEPPRGAEVVAEEEPESNNELPGLQYSYSIVPTLLLTIVICCAVYQSLDYVRAIWRQRNFTRISPG
jgi:hypothetical protein